LEFLARTSDYEEAWDCLPMMNMWVETGYKETHKHLKCQSSNNSKKYFFSKHDKVISYRPYVRKLMRENKNIIFYHIHPWTNLKILLEIFEEQNTELKTMIEDIENTRFYGKNIPRKEELLQECKSLLIEFDSNTLKTIVDEASLLFIPSSQDLESMIQQSVKFKKYYPEGSIKFALVSFLGNTQYGLTEEGRGSLGYISKPAIKK